jgi:flagellar basal body-associated protein FliL
METPDQESRLSLEKQRDNVRDAIWRATSRKDYEEVERLEGHLIELEEQIRRKK